MSEIPIAILAGYGSVGLGVEAMVGAVILAMVFGFSFLQSKVPDRFGTYCRNAYLNEGLAAPYYVLEMAVGCHGAATMTSICEGPNHLRLIQEGTFE